jgi:hypothetical protein
MNKDIKQLAEEMPLLKFRGWLRMNGEMSEDGKTITYNCEAIEAELSAIVEMYTAGAREATNRIKGLIKYDDCSMPITEADKLRKHGVAEYNKAISDVLNVLATTTPLSSSSGDAPVNNNNSI